MGLINCVQIINWKAVLSLLILVLPNITHQLQESCCKFEDSLCPTISKKVETYSNLRTADLIEVFGYPAEEHDLITEDGYFLTMQRIPYSNKTPEKTNRVPVLIMHGFIASSAVFFWQPVNHTIVFMLADAGFDVWLGNSRGNSYSLGHTNLSTDSLEYWDFSSHEIGKYDISGMINYILEATSQPSLYLIGYSLGGQQMFTALTLRPELNSKVRTFFTISPCVFNGNTSNIFFTSVAPIFGRYKMFKKLNYLSRGRFLPSSIGFMLKLTAKFCQYSLVNCFFCSNVYLVIGGYNPCQSQYEYLPGLMEHTPDMTSMKAQSHSSQAVTSGRFAQYNYGREKNMRVYGRPTPPDYNFSNLNVPIVMYSGPADTIVVPKDIKKLAGKLGSNLKEHNVIPYPCWTHVDFLAAKDAHKFIYRPIIEIMSNQTYG